MSAACDHDDIPHALLPLTLAVGLLRHKIYEGRPLTDQGRDGDLNMLANLIAEAIPIYEYPLDASKAPRPITRRELVGGMFRQGARELHFIDGRSPLSSMAVTAIDLERVLELLRDAQEARSRIEQQETPLSRVA